MDPLLKILVLLYAGVMFINTVVSAALWYERREPLLRAQFFLWASGIVGFFVPAVATATNFVITLGFSACFLLTAAIAHLLGLLTETAPRWRLFGAVLGAGYVLSFIAYITDQPFFFVSIPVAIGVALPALYTGIQSIATRWKSSSTSRKGLAISVVLWGIHMLDFALLRDKPEAAAPGYTAGILLIFVFSVFVPAVVIETVTQQRARIAAEMDVARRIQMNLLPKDPTIRGLELACYMEPAEEVGGDYYDIYTIGDRVWILLGDVTGHGLSSGLVMLMAQSIIRSILHTQPDISPSALNVLANKVLYDNLQRLKEDRQMTIVSICMNPENRFVLSGSHDNMYIYRHATREVETISVSQLPCGLGFVNELEQFDVSEATYQLYEKDLLLLITDGVTEAASGGDYSKGTFEEKRLISFIKEYADQPIEQIKANLQRKLREFTGGVFHDDVTFLIARMNPA
jgi:serine phosphatase RsbU (regulator of sigma subunit)